MDEERYIKERLDDQQEWHGKKAQEFKKAYYNSNIAILICTTLITVCSPFTNIYIRIFTSILGATATVLLGINKLKNYHENWLHYRLISETLKREKYFYLSRSGFYKNQEENSLNILVERVEQIISDENSNWAQINTQCSEKAN
ncbi:DUF4231 domain-containing protein [Sedimentibacter hydroxybenzoicus DSM 7310]|uniref:DUF4231 domain-containing protein n=1 Tax=Sedimentibacter hydroxybenzoicus DSM 7310 TaxID=1123245 RepID=A0A974BK88_SEDHY|nr:DUF4231 domain-containing protein [Sedimentibacter hydroxybenzoicus]NYB74835.1 DUF4231 domain-containing protein [Sedimentibacter hydroxybenzoicus DSM 7310]